MAKPGQKIPFSCAFFWDGRLNVARDGADEFLAAAVCWS